MTLNNVVIENSLTSHIYCVWWQL